MWFGCFNPSAAMTQAPQQGICSDLFSLMLRLILLTMLFSLIAVTPASAQPLSEQELVQQFAEQFEQQLQQAKVPGASYAIVHQNKILKIGHYGVRRQGKAEPVNADTVFRLASVSKTFAGALLVKAQAQHQLQLTSPITQYVPELQLKSPAQTASLTVQQVLSHSSGLWAHAFEDLIEADKTPEQILPRLRELLPVCPPGRCYSYQNVLFGLLSQVLERSTGLAYPQLIQQQLFQPLAMQSASVGLPALLARDNKAWPHQRGGNGWRAVQPKANFYRLAPAAGVNASARDLAKYLQAMLGQQPTVFSAEILAQLRQPLTKMPRKPTWPLWQQYKQVSAWYGHGWRMVHYDEHSLYYHAGVVDGYRPYIGYSVDTGYGLVLLTNAEADVTGALAGWFWQQVLPAGNSHITGRIAAQPQKKRRTKASARLRQAPK